MTSEINAARADVKRLEGELGAARERLYEAQCAAAGIRAGDIVTSKGAQYKVSQVDFFMSDNKPWKLVGVGKTKAGEWKERQTHIYTWDGK